MYEKVATFALLTAAVYANSDTADAYDAPAPGPAFPDYTLFTEVDQPSAQDIGDFPLLIDYFGFALWEDSDVSGDLKKWTDDSTWTGLDKYAPNGEVFGAIIDFSAVPASDDFGVVGIYCEGDPKSWIAYGASDPTNDGTYNDDPSNVPTSNGVTDKFDPSSLTEVKAEGNFEGMSGGLQDEFGQYWDDATDAWVIWNYNSGVDDWVAGNYTAWAGQFDAKSDTYFQFVGSFELVALGAVHLTVATLITTSVLYALF